MKEVIPFPGNIIFQCCYYVEVKCWSCKQVEWRKIIPENSDQELIIAVEGLVMGNGIDREDDQVYR